MADLAALAKLLLASGVLLGGHEFGHQIEADRLNVPIEWRGNSWGADWEYGEEEKVAQLAGAGLRFQDLMTSAHPEPNLVLASALEKLGYAVFPNSLLSSKGDIETIGKMKGEDAKKVAQGALVLSALADLHKTSNPERKWDVLFWQSSTGAPGIVLRLQMP